MGWISYVLPPDPGSNSWYCGISRNLGTQDTCSKSGTPGQNQMFSNLKLVKLKLTLQNHGV